MPGDHGTIVAGHGELAARVRAFDWASTSLGPLQRWPRALVHYVQMVLELPSPAVVFWGPDQTQIYNEGYAAIMGPRHPTYFGRPYRACWPDTYPTIYPWMRRVLDLGEVVQVDKAFMPLTRHGFTEETYFTFSFSPLRDDEGAIAGIFHPVIESTEAVLSERRTAMLGALDPNGRSEEAGRDVVRALSGDEKDIPFSAIYLWNDAERRLGLEACSDNLRGQRVDRTQMARVARKSFDANAPLKVEAIGSWLGDRVQGPWPEAIASCYVVPIRSAAPEKLSGVVMFGLSPRLRFDDAYRRFLELAARQVAAVMGRVRAHRELERRAELLAELDRAKTTFFSNASHELRTPLTLMLAPVEELLAGTKGPLTPAQREELLRVERNSRRMRKLVNGLLDFARLEGGRMQARYQALDLAQLTRDLASAFQSTLDRAGVKLVTHCPTLAAPVFADREMWEKIVLNLLSNAIKFTPKGEISLSLREGDDKVFLEVRDTGVGIAPEEIARLFERFHRVEGAPGRTHEGSGIGLALVHELVKLLGGVIQVESAVGQGSRFTVIVPRGDPSLVRADRGGEVPAPALTAEPFVQEVCGWEALADGAPPREGDVAPEPEGGARILIAEDSPDMRDYLRRLLEPRWIVEAAATGGEALELARTRPPDLVITDVMMPGMDGVALLSALRADERTRSTPVLVLSARAGEEARVEGLQAGADDYLVKPFSARELVARVSTRLELSRVRAAAERERKRLYSVFSNAPAAICVLRGPEHVVELINPAIERIVGKRPFMGRPLREVMPEAEGQGFFADLDRVYQTGAPFMGTEAPVSVAREDAEGLEQVFLNFVFQPTFDPDGAVDGILVFAFDVTDQVRARHAIQEARDRMTFALDAAGVGFWSTDFETLAAEASPSAERIFGQTPRQGWTFQTLFDQVVPEDRPRLAELLDDSRRRGEDWRLEYRILRGDGTVRWLLSQATCERAAEGRPTRMLGVVLDITDRKMAEVEREARMEDLARTLKFSELFVGVLGHDLRNPLQAISMAAGLLLRRSDTEGVRKPVSRILSSAERMARMIDQILDFTRSRLGGGIPVARAQTDAARIGREVIEELRETPGDRIELELDGDAVGRWDGDRLAQLLSNLVANALQHGEPGAPVQLRVDGQSRDRVVLEVQNRGAIPPDLLPVVFEPFRGTGGPGRTHSSGLGLGLFIARQIAQAHGGTLEVSSSREKGTCFRASLPRSAPEPVLEASERAVPARQMNGLDA